MERILNKEQQNNHLDTNYIPYTEGNNLDKINIKLEEIQIESLKVKYGIGYHEDDPKLKYRHQ